MTIYCIHNWEIDPDQFRYFNRIVQRCQRCQTKWLEENEPRVAIGETDENHNA